MQNKPEMFKLKIGDRCWSSNLIGKMCNSDLRATWSILKEGEDLWGIAKLIKEKTLTSKLLIEIYRRD